MGYNLVLQATEKEDRCRLWNFGQGVCGIPFLMAQPGERGEPGDRRWYQTGLVSISLL